MHGTEPMASKRLAEVRTAPTLGIVSKAVFDELLAEVDRLRSQSREDKRGRVLDSEAIGAGAEGSQLITWGGDIDQIEVRPSPHGGKVFLTLGMLKLDAYNSPETCPQVRVTLTDGHARELAAGIYESLGGTPGGAS